MLLDLQKQTGLPVPELTSLPDLPTETAHIWKWWFDLHSQRHLDQVIQGLSWSDIDAYCNRFRLQPKPWEMDALHRLDILYRWTQNPKSDKPITGLGTLKKQLTSAPIKNG